MSASKTAFLITGARGQIGRALCEEARARGFEVVGFGRDELDVTDRDALVRAVERTGPSWILNCAAATKVDTCEREPEWAETLNAEVPRMLAAVCKERGIALLHWSTDFVFDGMKEEPYREEDPVRPLSVYGRTKERGERAVLEAGLDRFLLCRTQWVYGPRGRNFPAAILARARSGEPLAVVDDQIGRPSYAPHLASAALDLIHASARGLFHLACGEAMSWYDFARRILDLSGYGGTEIRRIRGEDLDLPAPRPGHAVLDLRKLESVLGRRMPGVEVGLRAWLEASGTEGGDEAGKERIR